MSEVSVDEILTSCPQCGGPIIIIPGVYFPAQLVCSQCGFDLWKWFKEGKGGTAPEHSSTSFLVESPLPSSTASDGEGSSGAPNPSEHEDEVPEAKEAYSPRLGRDPLSRELPRLPATLTLTTSTRLRQLMKEDCPLDDGQGGQRLTHGCPTSSPQFSSSSFAGCPPETIQKHQPCYYCKNEFKSGDMMVVLETHPFLFAHSECYEKNKGRVR